MARNSSVCCLFAFTYLTASSAFAQQAAGIAGVVRDASGGIIPGVAVEASSDALIEKTRAVVTDGEGRYRIVDLRPGSYIVTFTLAGFTTVRRDGVLLTAGFTATINAELRIGSLEESITVAGASPLVDTQNAVSQDVISNELLAVLPSSSKALASVVNLTPGVSMTPDVGGSSGIFTSNQNGRLQHHGKGGLKISYDGLNVLNMNSGGVSYIVNQTTAVETAVQVSGTSAESTASGVVVNLIPKEGGNAFRGAVDGIYTNSHLQSDNLTDELRARGLTTGIDLYHLYEHERLVRWSNPTRQTVVLHRVPCVGNADSGAGRLLQCDGGAAPVHADLIGLRIAGSDCGRRPGESLGRYRRGTSSTSLRTPKAPSFMGEVVLPRQRPRRVTTCGPTVSIRRNGRRR